MAGREYQAVARLLKTMNCELSPAEVDGMLSGLLSVGSAEAKSTWIDAVLERSGRNAVDASAPVLTEGLECYADATKSLLDAGEFTFTPLLPPDELVLSQRLTALAAWCQGYLYGVGLGSLPPIDALTPESREFLADVQSIAHVDTVVVAGAGEQNEADFCELVEYLRVGVPLLYEVRPRSN